jgi:site-specific recombinase XerD
MTPHLLKHGFEAYLLENGVNLRRIQHFRLNF